MEGSTEANPEVLKDTALKNIYASCDVENKNSIPVGVLINYVRPYMKDNTSEFQQLEAALDPNNTNPCITSEVFYKAMSDWTMKLSKDDACFVNEKSFHEPHPSDSYLLNEKDFSFQSTSHPGFGQQMLQKCEGINLNLSNVSGYSLTDSSVPIMDTGFLEEKIKELEYNLCKTISENAMLKQQLASSEEQNENLQLELSNVKKKFLCAQQMLETLQKNKTESDDIKEELLEAKKQIEHMRGNFSASEKKVQNLTSWIRQLEEEKSTINKKTEQNVEKTQNLKREMRDLQDQLVSKCVEIQDLQGQIVALKEQVNEKAEGLDHLTKKNELLKQENICLRTNWKKYINAKNDSMFEKVSKIMSPTQIQRVTTATPPSPSNIALNSKQEPSTAAEDDDDDDSSELSMSYYSPEFLNQIAHPVTPSLGTPPSVVVFRSTRNSHSSEDCSPIPHPKHKGSLLKGVLTKHTSTPEERSTTESRTLLDSSLPSVSKKIPVMEFTTEPCRLMNDTYTKSPADTKTVLPDSSDQSKGSACGISVKEPSDGNFQSLNASSDDDVYYQLSDVNMMNCLLPGESLHDEIANAVKGIDVDELMEKVLEHEKCVHTVRSFENEIGELQAKLQELQTNANPATYLQQISENEKELNLLQQNLTRKDQMITDLRGTIENQDREIEQLTSEIKSECETKNALWQNMQKVKAELSKKDITISKCNEMEAKLEVLEKNYSILREKCTDFEKANGELNTANTKLENVHKDQKEQLNKLSKEITTYKNDIKKYKASEKQQAKVIGCVNEALAKAQEDNQTLTDKAARLQSEIKLSKEKAVQLQQENRSYELLLKEKETQIIQCKKDLATAKASLNNKHIELARIEADYNALRNKLSTLKVSNKQLETEHLNLKQENDASRTKLVMEMEKFELYKNDVAEFENFIKKVLCEKAMLYNKPLDQDLCSDQKSRLINMVSQIDRFIDRLMSENLAYKKTVECLESETMSMQNTARAVDETMNNKLLQLSNDKCKTEQDYKKLDIEYKDLVVKCRNKDKRLIAINNKLRMLKQKSGILQQKYNQITEENATLKDETATLSEKVESLSNSIEELITKSQAFEIACENLASELKTVDDQFQKERKIHAITEASLKMQIEDEKAKSIHWRKKLIETDDSNAKLGKQCDNLNRQNELKLNQLATLNSAFIKTRDSMVASRQNLISSTELVIMKLRHVLDGQVGAPVPNTMSDVADVEYNTSTASVQIETLVDEEIEKLNDQIHHTSQLLEYLASMYSKSTQDVEVQTEITEIAASVCMNSQQKPLNKFTLHQAKHVSSCPASPDSPSVMEQFMEFPNGGTQNVVDEWQGILLDSESMENSEGEILIDSKFQQAFPNQSDTFLQTMELHEDSPRKSHSKAELEEKFTALVMMWTLDRSSAGERYRGQHAIRLRHRQRALHQLAAVAAALRGRQQQHEEGGAPAAGAQLAQQLDAVGECIEGGLAAAEQCGVLRYEIRHTRYWNLVVNYVASLKQEIDDAASTRMSCLCTTDSSPKPCIDSPNGASATRTGLELRRRKGQCQQQQQQQQQLQLQVTTNSENFTCFKEDSVLPSVYICNSWKSVLFIVMFFSFVVLGLMMYVQWQCSRSAIQKPVCPFDYISKLFIRRVHVGMPPM